MKITNEEFDRHLEAICNAAGMAAILSIGDVRTILGEHFNNDVIAAWEKENPLPDFEKQIEPMRDDWRKLVESLIPQIDDDYRASEDDDIPGMCLTIGFTPETRESNASWSYQTGDNSYSGGAYSHPHWAVVSIYRDSKPSEIVDDIESQLGDLVSQ